MKTRLLNFFGTLPFVREFRNILKAYVFLGDNKYLSQKLSFSALYRQIFKKVIACLLISVVIYLISFLAGSAPEAGKVNDIILGIFPDLLGFGIGVYALIHVLPLEKYRKIQKEFDDGDSKLQATSLNSDMAYPIVAMLSVLLISVILEFFPSGDVTVFLNLYLLIYGMSMMFELVYVIFLFTQEHLSTISKNKTMK